MKVLGLFLFAVIFVAPNHAFLTDFGGMIHSIIAEEHIHLAIYNYTSKSVTCPEFKQQLHNVSEEVKNCVEEYKSDNLSVCRFMHNNFKKCMVPFKNLMEKCLPHESAEVPQFIVDSIMSFADYVCHAKGKQFLEFLHPCIRRQPYVNCVDKMSEELEMFKNTFPTKSQICHFIGEARTCMKHELEKECESAVTRDVFFGFYDALGPGCNVAVPFEKANEVSLDKENGL